MRDTRRAKKTRRRPNHQTILAELGSQSKKVRVPPTLSSAAVLQQIFGARQIINLRKKLFSLHILAAVVNRDSKFRFLVYLTFSPGRI